MNVIIANRFQTMLQSLDIDVIKVLNGEFDVEEIIASFQNFYFQRMVLDITAIKNYRDIRTIQKLTISLDMDKIILLLDDSPESSSSTFLSKIISMGIYNFTRNIEGVLYLYNNPNTYRDVAHLHQLDTPDMPVAMASSPGMLTSANDSVGRYRPRVIGLKNASKECGSTTLAYLMIKELEANYNVIGVEVDKRDFTYFRKDNMVSSASGSIEAFISKHSDKDCVIVDINGSKAAETACEIVLYLLEPSVIKLNRMVMINNRAVKELENKKVVLNKSLFEDEDIRAFEKETGLRIFYNMKPVNDRKKHPASIIKLLLSLGFDRLPVPEEY